MVARRGYKGGVRQTTLVGDINDAVNTIPGADLSTWSGATSNGASTATINLGQSDEETVTFTGISGNDLTGVTRGAAGTTAQAHVSGATLDHTSSVTDFDDANAHIADTTRDDHTQYAKTNGGRVIAPTSTSQVGWRVNHASGATGDLLRLDVNGTQEASIDAGGKVRAIGSDHYFGAYAFGTGSTVSRLHLSASGGTNVTLAAEGDGSNVQITYNTKGVGSHIWQVDGTSKMTLDSNGAVQAVAADHYFGPYAFGTGTGVSRLRISNSSTGVFLFAEGDGSNRDLVYRTKGTGAHLIQDASGNVLLTVKPNGHLLTGNGASGVPTTSSRHADFSSATVTGSDTSGRVALPTVGSPSLIAAGTTILHVAFANAYTTIPTVIAQSQDGFATVGLGPSGVTTAGFDIVTLGDWTPVNPLTYTVGWHVVSF